jgi:hypothetical protein
VPFDADGLGNVGFGVCTRLEAIATPAHGNAILGPQYTGDPVQATGALRALWLLGLLLPNSLDVQNGRLLNLRLPAYALARQAPAVQVGCGRCRICPLYVRSGAFVPRSFLSFVTEALVCCKLQRIND